MSSQSPQRPCYLVEWYRPEIFEETLDRTTAKLDECAESMAAQGSPVRLLMTLAVPSDEVVFALFDAPSADDVAQTCSRAGIPAERLMPAVDGRLVRARRMKILDSSAPMERKNRN